MYQSLGNTLGEDRHDKCERPRLYWEWAEILDPEVVVTQQRAMIVLTGQVKHLWSEKTKADLAAAQMTRSAKLIEAAHPVETVLDDGAEEKVRGITEEVEDQDVEMVESEPKEDP